MSRRAHRIFYSVLLAAGLANAASATAQTFAKTTHTGLFHPVAADLNGDGRPDIAGTALPGTVAAVMLNNGSGGFGPATSYPAGGNTMSMAGGDLNGDGRIDLVVTINQADIGLSLLMGNGNGTFQAPVTLPNTAGADAPSVVVTDLNNDGRNDIAIAHNSSCYTVCANSLVMSVLMGRGDGTFDPARVFEVGRGMNRIAVGDFNRDGVKDLAVSAGGGKLYRLLGIGDGTFTQLDTILLAPEPNFVEVSDVDVADFNRDGIEDLAAALSTDSSRIAVLIGIGDGNFQTPLIMQDSNLNVPQTIAVADYNGDGFLDLAYGFANGNQGLFAIRNGNGNGTFQAQRMYEVPPNQSSIGTVGMLTAQFNADTKPDLALAIGGAFPAHWVLLNTTGAAPPPALVAPTLLSPAQDAVVAQPVMLDWSDVAGATSYRVQIDDTSDFSSTAVNQVLSGSQYSASGLVAGRRYWWRARAINASGNGPYSASRRFTTQSGTPPPPPPPPPPTGDTATLTVSASGRLGERVQSSPTGINVPVLETQSATFTIGTAITLSVTNGRDAIWSGACSSSGTKRRTCAFTFTAAGSVSANVQ